MQQGQQAGCATVTRQLATKALSMATDAAPHRAPQGEKRWPIARALPAARLLIDQPDLDDPADLAQAARSLVETLADDSGKITDGFGHARPIYALFALHLLSNAAERTHDHETLEQVRQATIALLKKSQPSDDSNDPRLAVWRRLIARQHGIEEAQELPLPSEQPAPLVALGLNDLVDSWTYHELVGIHGLHLCSVIENDPQRAEHVRLATDYHMGHTQPDYTTYQPWGLAAFASNPQTVLFAEQQLHDVATHLSIEGPGGAVMPALLLADAAATMAGLISSVRFKP